MKVTVTHLKAPWPAGTVPGDVVELATDTIPAWATNKCTQAAEDAEVTHSMVPPAPALIVNPATQGDADEAAKAAAALAEAEAQAEAEKAALAAKAEAEAKAKAEAEAAAKAKAKAAK